MSTHPTDQGQATTWPVEACFDAATAVSHVLSPAELDAVNVDAPATPWFELQVALERTPEAYAAAKIAEAMLGTGTTPDGHHEWWAASGETVTAALCAVTGTEHGQASHLVAASVTAKAMAGRDRVEDAVLRLAERAAAWRKGHDAAQQAT